ncbi:MAG TPA: hypothetical protein VNG53_09295, partial [Bacteroidia bacterium]|nr:hypothetical protein [Bacteroidia bacterium]
MNKLKSYLGKFFILILFPISIFLAFNMHSHDKYNNYHSVIWADAAGYYVYLPMWYIYGNNAKDFPANEDTITGNGFYYDKASNKIHTKYLCGVALMQTPFFITANYLAPLLGFKADGFSKIYHWSVMMAGIFYACLGLFFLYYFLNRFYLPIESFITTLAFFVGTNLYYYSIDAQGMSHVYSFFLLSFFLYLIPFFYEKPTTKNSIGIAFSFALMVFIRPTNFIVLFFFLFYNLLSWKQLRERIAFLKINFQLFLWMLLAAILIAIPQMIYWKQTFHRFITYSYSNESFIYWKNPHFIKLWFSTNNGLFLYAPLLLISIFGIFWMIKKAVSNGWIIGILFLTASYIFASWWCWWFGCSFGSRS